MESSNQKSNQGLSRAAKKRAKKKKRQHPSSVLQNPKHSVSGDNPPLQMPAKERAVPKPPINGKDESSSKEEFSLSLGKRKYVRYEDICEDSEDLQPAGPKYHSVDDIANFSESTDKSSGITSGQRARAALEFLLGDVSCSEFYANYWEKKPLIVRKEHCKRFEGLLSKAGIKQMLQEKAVYYGRDLNLTSYEMDGDGVKRRKTLDEVKPVVVASDPTNARNFVKADADNVWFHYGKGCSVRLLCPHEHFDLIHTLLSSLEIEWGCMVGSNAYLTPCNGAQGFAPHYDDIEAFCLQLEGRKRWKVYAPLNSSEELPRYSSSDYADEDLKHHTPEFDIILEQGDLLYMPRGWIHQACTLASGADNGEDSLHLTISAMQQWTWVDLLENLLPEALASASSGDISNGLRQGLPRQFLDYMGAVNDIRMDKIPEALKILAKRVGPEDDDDRSRFMKKQQDSFRDNARKRIMAVANEAMEMLDAACDQMGKRFISERQPPALSQTEKMIVDSDETILPTHLCRLVRPGIARMVLEDEKAIVYHCSNNSRNYHGRALSPLEFELDDAPAVEQLLTTVEPHWICVADLVHDTLEDKVGVTQALFDEDIILLRHS